MRLSTIFRVLGTASFLAFSSTSGSAQSQQEALQGKKAIKGSDDSERRAEVVEHVDVARSTRISTTVPATAFCNKAPFKAVREAYFIWSSIETRPEDGRVSNPAVKTIGDIRGVSYGGADFLTSDSFRDLAQPYDMSMSEIMQ